MLIDNDKKIGVRELMSMGSFDEVTEKLIEDEVDVIMRGSHDDQISYMEKNFSVSIRENYDEWASFIEIFERRNLAAHGNLIANKRYLSNCKNHGFDTADIEVGTLLKLDSRYLRRSADRLLEFGISLNFVLWLKHYRDTAEKAYEALNGLTFELIRDAQPRVASRLLEMALFSQKVECSDRIHKMMLVNLANAHKKLKNTKRAHEIIDQVDWSATTDNFKICVASILEDIDQIIGLMDSVFKSGLIEKSDFREWPVFEWIREDERVNDKFFELYGEQLHDASEGSAEE